IDAGAGNDFLNGTYQRDVLIGGAGDDIMRGDEQTDIYVIESGHGFDLIDDRGTLSHDWAGGVPGTLAQWLHGDMVAPLEREFGIDSDEAISSGAVSADRVLFGPGILPSTVQAKLVRGPDFYGVDRTLLELRWNDGDGLRVVGDYSTIRSTDSGNALFSGGELAEGEGIERYEFTDGTIWTARAARERALAQMNTVEIGPGSPEHVLTPGQAEAVRFKLTGEELLRPMDVPLISQDRNDLVFVLEGHTLLRLKDAVRPDGSATMPLLFWDNTVEITWSTGEGTFIWHEPEVIPEPIVRVDAPGHRGLLSGGAGDDTLQGSDGNDVVDGGPGDDVLTGDGGIVSTHTVTRAGPLGTLATVMRQLGPRIREYVQSGDFDRILSTTIAPGIPLTIGSALAILVPHLRNTTSNDLVHGGAGNDQLSATAGYDLLIGGAGDDALSVDTEGATVAYNRGDGRDCIESRPSAHLVLSLGGGLTVRDIELRRDGRDLDVDIAGGGEVSFTDWFDGLQVLRTTTLQVVESPAAGTQTATVRRYDFDAYAAAFQSDGAGRVDIERFRIESPAVPIPGDESAIAYGLGMGVGIGDVNRTLADLAVRPPAITTPQRILELIQTAGLNA
ncbi:MAG: hypothetical protein KIT73_06280, partial [Burkholderiales bacterium]|nr:hypothetical protein [Burkholderiales bacterium]